jgi:hypothetical protein
MSRILRIASLAIWLLGSGEAQQSARRPKLVLAIVVDQFRYDYLLRFRDGYTSGLARLLRDGAVFSDARYQHAFTVTAVGHSTFLSGATPSISGIIANDWYDRESGQNVSSVSDRATKLVGGPDGRPGASPRRMQVSTVGDELKNVSPDTKIISISIKDRSAILPGGHRADAAYWYENDSNSWVTSTFYRNDLPGWASQANSEHWYQRSINAKWFPLGANASAKPFCTTTKGAPEPACGSIEATPWGNEIIEEFAERAIANEKLGTRGATDLLAVSFSANDYVGHALGPDNPAVRDMALRTDRLIGKLIEKAEASAGPGRVLVVLTADHGVCPLPELNAEHKMPGGRLSRAALTAKIKDALVKRFGPGEWFLGATPSNYYLNLKLIETLKVDPAVVEQVVADIARAEPHIARVLTRSQLSRGEVQQDPIGRAFTAGFFPERSGDVFVLQEPYYLWDATGTSHGTPYGYDNHVPVIFMGAGIRAGQYSQPAAPNDIAPTLATILQIETPSGSVGHVLREILASQPTAVR